MKINKQILVAALVVGVSYSSLADFSLSPGSSVTVQQGNVTVQTAYYNLTVAAGGDNLETGTPTQNFADSGAFLSVADIGIYPAFNAGASSGGVAGLTDNSYTAIAQGTYTIAVSWVLSPSAATGVYNGTSGLAFSLVNNSVTPTDTIVRDQVTVFAAGVPEPAQTAASAMLLGCGGLVFASRRLLKKQTA